MKKLINILASPGCPASFVIFVSDSVHGAGATALTLQGPSSLTLSVHAATTVRDNIDRAIAHTRSPIYNWARRKTAASRGE